MADGVAPDDELTATRGTQTAADGEGAGSGRYLEAAAAHVPGGSVGRYRIESVLGRGGEGIVLAAHDPLLDRPVALKLLRPERRAERDRLLREGKAIARLRHPNVVTVYDVGEHGNDLFIAMELVRGDNLRTWMARPGRTWRAGLALVVAAGRGLAAAHAKGMVHGDFKPENILVAADGHVVVGDFGLARAGEQAAGRDAVGAPNASSMALAQTAPGDAVSSSDVSAPATGPVHGTPAYLAPEQWRGRPSTAASDQFAFAVTLHELVFGCRPFERRGQPSSFAALAVAVESGERVPVPPHRVPRRIVRAIDRALSLDPAARFPSLEALLAEVTPRRRRWWLPVATAVAAAAAVTAFTVARDATRDDPRRAGCERAAAQAGQAWTAANRAAYLANNPGVAWAGEHAAWLDAFAAEWSQTRRDVCRGDAPLVGTQADAAAACLDAGLDALRTAAVAPATTWPELPDVRDCLAPPTLRYQSRSLGFGPQGYPRLSPDGTQVAVTHLAGDAYTAELDATPRPRPVAGAREILNWLDDGSLYVSRADHTYERVLADGTVTRLGTLPGFVPRASQLSPDGAYVSFELAHAVEIRETAGGTVVGRVEGKASQANWEPTSHRLAVGTDSGDLAIFDVRTRRVSTLPVRAAIGPTAARSVAWLRDGEIAMSGALASADRRIALWSLTIDDTGALARAPRLRLTPAPATGYMPSERRAGRLALETYSLKQRTFLWRDGQAREQHSTLDHADVIDVDGPRGLALSRRDGDLLLYPLDGSAPPTTIAAAAGTYSFRDGVITTVRPDADGGGAAGHWALTEIASDGTPRVAGRFTWDATDVQLACQGAHCILFAHRGDTLVVRPLTPALTVGTELALPGQRGVPAPSADGRRLLMIRDADSVVVEVDAYSGRVLEEHHVIGADCYMFGAGWRAGTPGIWAKFACADRFSLVHGPVAGRYEPILDSDGWMSGVAAFGNDAYLYSVQDNDAHLLIVLGL